MRELVRTERFRRLVHALVRRERSLDAVRSHDVLSLHLVGNGKEPPRARDALQSVLTPVNEREARSGHQVLHSLRNEHLEGPAAEPTLAPMFRAMPPSLPSIVSHSPVCSPARISIPRGGTSWTMVSAQRMARAGPSNEAKNPAPAVPISTPRKRPSKARTPE